MSTGAAEKSKTAKRRRRKVRASKTMHKLLVRTDRLPKGKTGETRRRKVMDLPP